MNSRFGIVLLVSLLNLKLPAEPLKITLAGTHSISPANPEGSTLSLAAQPLGSKAIPVSCAVSSLI